MTRRLCAAAAGLLLAGAVLLHAADRYQATGMVVEVDAAHGTFVAAIDSIPGFMAAMTMPFHVRDAKELTGLVPGAVVQFTLVVDTDASYAEGVQVRRYQAIEQDPMAARRLSLFRQITSGRAVRALSIGDPVPDFTLTDQKNRRVTFSSFRGKVVGVNFMYTTCQLPDYCLRMVNNFGALQKRFAPQLGPDLIFLTITFDPVRDTPDVLDRYASQWKPNPDAWHFLTGPAADIQRVLDLFGVSAFPDEGLMDHSLHTVLVDRTGRMAANIEGNQYSTDQLAAVLQGVLRRR
jgi:protein SCO1/2